MNDERLSGFVVGRWSLVVSRSFQILRLGGVVLGERLRVDHRAVGRRQEVQVFVRRRRERRLDRVEPGTADGCGRQTGMCVRIVGRVYFEISFSQRPDIGAKDIIKRRIDLERHMGGKALPENAGNNATIS